MYDMKKMKETTFADNDYVLLMFSKKLTFSLKKKITLQEKLLQLRKKQIYDIDIDDIENLENVDLGSSMSNVRIVK